MISDMVTTSNLGMYRFTKEHEKIVEGIIDEFCLIFSSIKAVSPQLGRGVAK